MMASVSCVVLWLGLGVFGTVMAGHITPTTMPTLSAGEQLLLQEMQRIQSPCSLGGKESDLELMKNKLLTLETKMEATQATLSATQTTLSATQTTLSATQTKLEMTETKLRAELNAMKTKQEATQTKVEATDAALQTTRLLFKSKLESGSTFVRWGRTTCSNSSQVVYTGVAGGGSYGRTGSAVNLLCLTMAPQSDGSAVPPYVGLLYGAEYRHIPPNHHNHNAPCSVCRAAQSTTIMIPATRACPLGWTTQFTGHLASGTHDDKAATQYVCLDKDPEHTAGGHRNEEARLLYYTVTRCGSLPCPPYANNQVVLCVVCSK